MIITSRITAAWKAFQAPTLLQSNSNSNKWYNYDSMQLFGGGNGTIDKQLARNVFGANLAYQTIPEVKAALDTIAEEAAVIPMLIKDKQGNIIARSDENPQDSPLLMAILDSQGYTGDSLVSLVAYSLKMVGMAFVQIVRNPYGFAKGLRWLNPAAVQIDCPSGEVRGYWYYPQGGSGYYLQPHDVIRLRDFNPDDDIYGYGTTLAIMGKANAVLNFDRMKVSYYRNGGQPGLMVSFKEAVDIKQAEELAEFWRRTHRGVDEWFKTQISHIPLEMSNLEPLDISKPLEVTIEDSKSILKGYRVAPEMIGDTTNNPYQFSPEKRYAFMLQVEQPITNKLAWALNKQAAPLFEEAEHQIYWDYDAFNVVTETEKSSQEMLHQDWQNGRITFNEYRQGNNYDPVTGGDFYLFPSGKIAIPATDISRAAELLNPQPAAPVSPALPQAGTGEPVADAPALPVDEPTLLEPTKKYDPNQPRDGDGQFGSGGGSSSGGGNSGDKPSGDSSSDKPKKPAKPKKPKKPDSDKPNDKPPSWASQGNRNASRDPEGYMDYGHMDGNPSNVAGQMKAEQLSATQMANVPSREQNAIQTYTGEDYRNINNSLRRGEIDEDYADTIDDIDSAMRDNALSEPTVLYRGMTMNDELRNRIVPGATFSDAAYTSTSFDMSRADSFAGGANGAVLRIKASSGQNGLAVSSISEYPEEHEFLLPRNTRYSITSVSRDPSGRTYIDAEILTDEAKMKAILARLFGSHKAKAEPPQGDRADRYTWNDGDIVFDEPIEGESDSETEPSEADETDTPDTEKHLHSHDIEVETWDYTPSLARKELAAWQRHVKAKASRPFEPRYTRGDIADIVTSGLASGADMIPVFDSAFALLPQSLDSLKTAFIAVFDALQADDDTTATKSLQSIRLDFEGRFADVLNDIRSGNVDNRRRAGDILRQLIRTFGYRAYVQGLQDGGVMDNPSEEDEAEIASLRSAQSTFVSNITRVLIREDGVSDSQAAGKPEMWWRGSIQPFYNAGLASANANGLYEWVLGATEAHCTDCPRLNGQRHRLKHWRARNLQAGTVGQNTVCKGYKCECKLIPASGKAQGKF